MIEVKHGADTYILVREQPTSLDQCRNSGTAWLVHKLDADGNPGPILDRDFYRNDIEARIKCGAYETGTEG